MHRDVACKDYPSLLGSANTKSRFRSSSRYCPGYGECRRKIHFFAFTHGKWDVIVADEAPTEAAFVSVIAKVWMAGMIQDVETIPCIAQKTVTEVMSSAGNADYKAPGQ